ncbi:MAG: flagellar biosynthesis protein FlhB [Planctomycetes bacterium]|nr:flagellar biosynthesis protein FlhB [Planctomycetota bacterium]
MADSAAEKTEPPTPGRLRKAREEGRVPQSQELALALTLGMLLVALGLSAGGIWQWFAEQMTAGVSFGADHRLDVGRVSALLSARGWDALMTIVPFMVALGVASVASGLLVGGWAFAPKAIRFNPQAINPVNGLKKLISARSLVRLVASWAKLGVMAAIALTYLRGRLDECLALAWATPLASLKVIMEVIFGLVARFAAAMLVIALLDVLYQRWQHRKDLRMTRQEVKEERRQHEAAPEVRSRLRRMQFEMIRKRMLHEVPQADVVLTNPTHVAVALKYNAGDMNAPQVTAKGADYLAERIREIARAHGVPIVERPELARTLYRTVEVGRPIPEPLYVAVAEILAMIYRLRRKRQGTRP